MCLCLQRAQVSFGGHRFHEQRPVDHHAGGSTVGADHDREHRTAVLDVVAGLCGVPGHARLQVERVIGAQHRAHRGGVVTDEFGRQVLRVERRRVPEDEHQHHGHEHDQPERASIATDLHELLADQRT